MIGEWLSRVTLIQNLLCRWGLVGEGHPKLWLFVTDSFNMRVVKYDKKSVSHPSNENNVAKTVTILKLCERSFKWDHAGCPTSFRLEMALGWRQVVKNLEIHHVIFMSYLYSNIKIKRIESEICSWRHFKENSKLFNLIMDII